MKFFSPSAIRAEKRLLAGLALIVVIAVVVAIVLLTRSPGSSNAADQTSNGSSTATVQRRDLVETDTESGTLSYANAQTIYNRVSGTITWLPAVGQVIHPGQALFRINAQPITLMNGSTPAYRDLSASDVQGPDVLELNRNLIALGFNPYGIVADDVWQAATTAGVEQYQASLGETETGILTLGQVVFLPGPQLISTVDGTVGSTGGGSGGTAGTSYDLAGSHTEFVTLTTTTQTSTTPTTTPTPPPHQGGHSHKPHHGGHEGHKGSQSLSALVALLKAEIQELKAQQHGSPSSPSSPSSHHSHHHSSPHSSSPSNNSSSHSPSSSSSGSSATEILQSSSTRLVVTVDLAASSQSEAVRGEHVTVEMPNNTTVNGVITQVSKVAQTSSSDNSGAGAGAGGSGAGGTGSGGSSATIPVTIKLLGHITGVGLDQAPVSVNFAQAKAKNVLSVPVTALVATAGGSYAVQEAAAPHKLVPVKTGLFAAGYVAISGSGIYQGLQVTDSQG
ncbi:MAG TPA: peptidoglycan-binding domain-containing protein [Solirubrobacteraceae bacterium]|nr:peptidoglycan-binding domain-containing protein [Solirubrobacteraceae bacterium]